MCCFVVAAVVVVVVVGATIASFFLRTAESCFLGDANETNFSKSLSKSIIQAGGEVEKVERRSKF